MCTSVFVLYEICIPKSNIDLGIYEAILFLLVQNTNVFYNFDGDKK